jgi:hypothetical protein
MRRATDRVLEICPALEDRCLAIEDSLVDFETMEPLTDLSKVEAAADALERAAQALESLAGLAGEAKS